MLLVFVSLDALIKLENRAVVWLDSGLVDAIETTLEVLCDVRELLFKGHLGPEFSQDFKCLVFWDIWTHLGYFKSIVDFGAIRSFMQSLQ